MTKVLGSFNHEDGSFDFAIAEPEPGDEPGLKVVAFPETGQTVTYHNVATGTGGGEFSTP